MFRTAVQVSERSSRNRGPLSGVEAWALTEIQDFLSACSLLRTASRDHVELLGMDSGIWILTAPTHTSGESPGIE